jgi:hypothetical protein
MLAHCYSGDLYSTHFVSPGSFFGIWDEQNLQSFLSFVNQLETFVVLLSIFSVFFFNLYFFGAVKSY